MEESISQSHLIVGGVVAVLVFNLGLIGFVRLVVLLVLLAVSALIAFLLALYSSARVDDAPRCSRVVVNRSGLNLKPISRRSVKQSSLELTGSVAVDGPLQEMLDNVIRDYVYTWYYKISANQQFPAEVRSCLWRAVCILAERMGEVDWVNHLTTTLVDDVASHLRLYKLARSKFRAPLKEGEARPADLESLFFDAEMEMEGKICRDFVCQEPVGEMKYIQDLCDLLLYLLLPDQEFESGSVRVLTREILACSVLQPLLHLVADPDVINQNLIWLLKDCEVRSEVFISTLRHSDSLQELEACRANILKELTRLRSRDSHADDSDEAKNQLNSLLYLKKVVDSKINRLQSGFSSNSYGLPANIDWSSKISSTSKLFNLPLEVILKNNVSLSYFIDFMSSLGCQYLVFFYLNVEGWKVAAEQQLQALEREILKQEDLKSVDDQSPSTKRPGTNEKESACLESIREAAISIYQEYISEKASPRVILEDTLSKRLVLKIRTETPDPGWFDEVAGVIYKELETDEKYLVSFKRSVGYLKLLAELDLLKADIYEDDEDGSLGGSLGDSLGDGGSTGSMDTNSCKSAGHDTSSGSEGDLTSRYSPNPHHPHSQLSSLPEIGDRNVTSEMTGEIVRVEMGKESGKQFALYVIRVARGGNTWEINRRYSDFHHLHSNLNSQFPSLEKIPFPGKKTFGNLERNIVQKRQKMLSVYLQEILSSSKSSSYPGLGELLLEFLLPSWGISRPNVMERAVTAVSQDIQKSVKTVSSAVASVPGNIVKTMDNTVDNITKALINKDISSTDEISSVKVGASIEDNEENIPLRITLLFLDEVFDLADRNMWLRRQIITVLRQIINTMFGDIVNKKIVDYFSTFTSEEAVSTYLNSLKEAIWPGGRLAPPSPIREDDVKQRCRVAARASLLASLPDDLKRVIGSETSRAGLVMIFEMLQYTTLNRRLVIVLLEGVLSLLFPNHLFREMFEKLHSRSGRARNDLKNSQRTASDLRHRREKSK